MGRRLRIGAVFGAGLIALLVLHVQLNLGGWQRVLRRSTTTPVRGDLVVGFLPVT